MDRVPAGAVTQEFKRNAGTERDRLDRAAGYLQLAGRGNIGKKRSRRDRGAAEVGSETAAGSASAGGDADTRAFEEALNDLRTGAERVCVAACSLTSERGRHFAPEHETPRTKPAWRTSITDGSLQVSERGQPSAD